MRIHATEQELLLPEIGIFVAAARDGAVRARYQALHAAVQAGEVDDDLAGHLANILEIGLQSGRLRGMYGADGEQALTRLFHRTPAGAELAGTARSVSEALAGLNGQRVEGISVSALGPGSYGITIDTEACQVTLRLTRAGASVESVAVGI